MGGREREGGREGGERGERGERGRGRGKEGGMEGEGETKMNMDSLWAGYHDYYNLRLSGVVMSHDRLSTNY